MHSYKIEIKFYKHFKKFIELHHQIWPDCKEFYEKHILMQLQIKGLRTACKPFCIFLKSLTKMIESKKNLHDVFHCKNHIPTKI